MFPKCGPSRKISSGRPAAAAFSPFCASNIGRNAMLAPFTRAALAILAGVAGSTFVVALPAAAQDTQVVVRGLLPSGTQMRLVTYRDLNLNLIAHRKILNQRV